MCDCVIRAKSVTESCERMTMRAWDEYVRVCVFVRGVCVYTVYILMYINNIRATGILGYTY